MLHYTPTQINRDFLIKVFGRDQETGRKINTLVGVSGFVALVGEEFANKFIERAYRSAADKCCCKLRRGLQVTLYAH